MHHPWTGEGSKGEAAILRYLTAAGPATLYEIRADTNLPSLPMLLPAMVSRGLLTRARQPSQRSGRGHMYVYAISPPVQGPVQERVSPRRHRSTGRPPGRPSQTATTRGWFDALCAQQRQRIAQLSAKVLGRQAARRKKRLAETVIMDEDKSLFHVTHTSGPRRKSLDDEGVA